MLTKTDLKSIRSIVREEVEAEVQNVKDELQSEMKMNLVRTLSEIKNLSGRLKNIEIKMNKLLNLPPITSPVKEVCKT